MNESEVRPFHVCTEACADTNSECPVPEDYSDSMYDFYTREE